MQKPHLKIEMVPAGDFSYLPEAWHVYELPENGYLHVLASPRIQMKVIQAFSCGPAYSICVQGVVYDLIMDPEVEATIQESMSKSVAGRELRRLRKKLAA